VEADALRDRGIVNWNDGAEGSGAIKPTPVGVLPLPRTIAVYAARGSVARSADSASFDGARPEERISVAFGPSFQLSFEATMLPLRSYSSKPT
jgi:hypothetical protein